MYLPVDNFGTVVGENPDCLLLSGTVVGENPDHVCWADSYDGHMHLSGTKGMWSKVSGKFVIFSPQKIEGEEGKSETKDSRGGRPGGGGVKLFFMD